MTIMPGIRSWLGGEKLATSFADVLDAGAAIAFVFYFIGFSLFMHYFMKWLYSKYGEGATSERPVRETSLEHKHQPMSEREP